MQVVLNYQLSASNRKKTEHTIFVKTRIVNGEGVKEAGVRHLFVSKEGKLHFHINGYGMLMAKTTIKDGLEHQIAVRHLKDKMQWEIYVDGVCEAHKVI